MEWIVITRLHSKIQKIFIFDNIKMAIKMYDLMKIEAQAAQIHKVKLSASMFMSYDPDHTVLPVIDHE